MRLSKSRFSNVATIEIFGATFALLIVLFLLLNIINESELQQRLSNTVEEGRYKISWSNNSEGFVVIAFADNLFIIERNQHISKESLCQPSSKFVDYARDIYQDKNKQMIFAITEGGIGTMRLARDCLMQTFPKQAVSVGWIIANNELLTAVEINQIPAYIKRALQ